MNEASIHMVLGKHRSTVSVSAGIEELLGFSPQDFLSGKILLEACIHKDDDDVAALLLGDNLGPIHGSVNFRLRHANGRILCVWGEYKKSASPNLDSSLLELRLIDAKSLPRTLEGASNLASFRSMMDNTDDYIYFKDRNHVFTGASQTLVSICDPVQHWTDLLGLTDYDVFPEPLADVYYKLEKDVFSGVAVAHEVQEIVSKKGKKGWVDNRKYPIRNEAGEIIGLFGIARDITELKEMQQTLQRSEFRLNEAQRLAGLGNWDFDLSTQMLYWSDEVYRIFEVDPAHFVPSYDTFMLATHPQDRERVASKHAESLISKVPYEIGHRLLMKDGRVKYVNERVEFFFGSEGQALRTLGTVQDITAEKEYEEKLRRLNRDLRLLSDCNMALIHAKEESRLLVEICRLCVDKAGYVMAWVGYAQDDAGKTVQPAAQCGDHAGYLEKARISWADTELGHGPTGTAIRTGQAQVSRNILNDPNMEPWRDLALQRHYQSSLALPLICDEKVLGALMLYASEADAFDAEELRLLMELASDLAFGIVTLRTAVQHAEAKQQLEFLSHFDALTKLPNRLLLQDRFEQAAAVARTEADAMVAFLYLDLDRFKQINDSLGYAVGDQVLVMSVERLRQCIPKTATLSRLSGDEFVVLLSGNDDVARIVTCVTTILEKFSEPFELADSHLSVPCTIGISLFPSDGDDFNALVKQARAAVDSAKDAGRNTYRFFSKNMNEGLAEQIRLTGDFPQAIRKQEFLLHYQPQVDMRSGRITGVEALMRWQHPIHGLIPPDRFIALAEHSGYIVQMGEWVLNEACRQARVWADRYPAAPVMAVNLSAIQFKRSKVTDLVESALAVSGLPAGMLELELTESILLQDVDATVRTLSELKAMGVKLSIDDFGTGYSSLSYLKQLAVHKLKIDRSFVNNITDDSNGDSIVRAIIDLGHILQLTVIAEGVETEAQRSLLEQSGCDEGQGYLFSRPVPADQFERLLDQSLPG